MATHSASSPRERLLDTAAKLFYREGINGVGVDRVLSEAGVTRATMYRHFAGKEALVVAYLEREDAVVRSIFASAAIDAVRNEPRELLSATIDGIAKDATRRHTRGCPFINASAEYPDPKSEVRQVVRRQRTWFRTTIAHLAEAAGLDTPKEIAGQLVMLRDAMFVGQYLDGRATEKAFRSAARTICGLD